ncbi:MAG: hypothetical protein M0R80_27405 [Proteobacteria bacterium]|nr:hypothetical protein [Pseudomonadota bacterium]
MAGVFKRILLVALFGAVSAGCWRSAGLGADGGGDTDTLDGITDPEPGTDDEWITYGWGLDFHGDEDLSGVFGFSSSDVLVVGEGGTILRYDGTDWTQMAYPANSPVADLGAVWGSAPWDVFTVGSDGVILHYDGDAWTQMDSGTSANLHDVCGRSHDDVYAVGDGGALLAYDGATWSPIAAGTDRNLFAAWCAPGTAVWAAGHANDAYSSSVLLRYDGAITLIDHPTAHFLYALGGTDTGTIFIGGVYQEEDEDLRSEIYRSTNGATFEPVCSNAPLLLDLFAVGEGNLWAVGQRQSGPAAGSASITHFVEGQICDSLLFDETDILRGVWRDLADPMGIVFAVGDGGAVLIGEPIPPYGM